VAAKRPNPLASNAKPLPTSVAKCVPALPGAAPIFGNSDGNKLAAMRPVGPAKPGPHRR